jgi:predicted nucleic acid-binding protein
MTRRRHRGGRVLVDTGPIVAILSESDQHHQACIEVLQQIPAPLLTCWPVITEAAWLLRAKPRDVQRLLKSVGEELFQLLPLESISIEPIAGFMRKYERQGAQLADACLLHLAEREQIETVFTLDVRDFTVYRIKRNRHLHLLPRP